MISIWSHYHFVQCNDINAIIGSWSFAPAKLIDGEQKKPEGKVTKRLRIGLKKKLISTFRFMVHGGILMRLMTIGIVQALFFAIIVPVSEMINPGRLTVNGIALNFNLGMGAVLGGDVELSGEKL